MTRLPSITIDQALDTLEAVEMLAAAHGVTVDVSIATLPQCRVLRIEFVRGPRTVGLLRIGEDKLNTCKDAGALTEFLEREVSKELRGLVREVRA